MTKADNIIAKIEEQITKVDTKQLDISFNELADMYESKELNIKPSFQRLFRWSVYKQSRFIESLILEMPVPPIFVIEVADGEYELIDGLQRISSYLNFRGLLTNEDGEDANEPLILTGCEIVPELDGQTFKSLPTSLKIRLKRTFIRVQVIRKESDAMLRYHMFKRLNTGGERLEPQEVRNCNVRLIDDKFADFLEEISRNKSFNAVTNISEKNSMSAYREELALRFFANKNDFESYSKDIEPFLDSYMEKVSIADKKDEPIFDYENDEQVFEKVFLTLEKSLGEQSFGASTSGNISKGFRIYHYESIPIALASISNKYDINNKSHIDEIQKKLIELKEDEDFQKMTTGGGKNTKKLLEERFNKAKSYLDEIDFS